MSKEESSKTSTAQECRKNFTVGIIGLGAMGSMYARRIAKAGWNVIGCDLPEREQELKRELEPLGIKVLCSGFAVTRLADYCMYCVETSHIDSVIATYGPTHKQGAIVGGQTSCKSPEIAAFCKYLSPDVEIITCHSLHGPDVDPYKQPLVVINHNGTEKSLNAVLDILSCLQSKFVHMTCEEHDQLTANTQAVTHAAFLSMGYAWMSNNQYPWELNHFSGGIENVKINTTLRLFSNNWHVYAGVAISNPTARLRVQEYANSVTELFSLLLEEKYNDFETRIREAGKCVFGAHVSPNNLLLNDSLLDEYSLSRVPEQERVPNNHLSLLAMVDCWNRQNVNVYDLMIASTPIFRLLVGSAEYLFLTPDFLDSAIHTAINMRQFRRDDLEFTISSRQWANCISAQDMNEFQRRFERCQKYFTPLFNEARKIGNDMIKNIIRGA